MSVIIISFDEKIHSSFICRNTDIFNKIENLLYERYPQYKESENYFHVKGRKINKYKTFEENEIKNDDVIFLYRSDK